MPCSASVENCTLIVQKIPEWFQVSEIFLIFIFPITWSINYLVIYLAVLSYHVTSAFYSESTLCSYLIVKELLAQNRYDIWKLSDCNRIRIHNHLVCKWTLNYLATLVVAETYSRIIYGQLQIIFQHHQMLNLNKIHTKSTTPFSSKVLLLLKVGMMLDIFWHFTHKSRQIIVNHTNVLINEYLHLLKLFILVVDSFLA